jgi:hypothetical protein
MKKKALNKEIDNRDNREESMLDMAVTHFIAHQEERIQLYDAMDNNIPIMTRIDHLRASMLDHLAKRWRKTRSGLACEILEEMIYRIFEQLYKDKTEDELRQIYIQINNDYEKKNKSIKKNKK